MDQIPDFWRTEVFHPLSVHFPIALLLIAFVFQLIALRYKRELWEVGGTVLLALGVVGVWVAVYTGDLADGIVSRNLCDPTVLKEHENLAYVTAWLFTSALVVDLLKNYSSLIKGAKMNYLKILLVLLMGVGSGYLMYVGHLGATLVYQQAAGVYQPSADCNEFN